MSIKNSGKHFSVLVFLMVLSIFSFAQIRTPSPYSRFGLGDLSENNNAWNLSLGGASLALRHPHHINYANPASYTAFDSLSFVFEGGFNIDFVKLTSNVQTANRTFASVGYILFGMPVTKWWRTSLGLVPYSKIGYSILSTSNSGPTRITTTYTGSGGINRFFWGNGFKVFKGLSLGFNMSYLFGSLDYVSTILFPDSIYFANYELQNHLVMNDIYFNFGAQYTAKLKKDLSMTFGGVFSNESDMSAKTDLLARTFAQGGDGTQVFKDTVAFAENYKGKIIIPLMFGVGVSMAEADKWLVGADFKWQNWSDFRAFGISDSLVDSYSINVGAEFVPDINSYSNYLKRVRYRIGFMYNSTYLQLYNQHLREYALTLGFGTPVRGMKTGLNFSVQIGSRGTTQADLIKEGYLRFTVGFTIFERWFVKRKYF